MNIGPQQAIFSQFRAPFFMINTRPGHDQRESPRLVRSARRNDCTCLLQTGKCAIRTLAGNRGRNKDGMTAGSVFVQVRLRAGCWSAGAPRPMSSGKSSRTMRQ